MFANYEIILFITLIRNVITINEFNDNNQLK